MKTWNPIRRALAILMTLVMLMSLVPAMGVTAATADDGVNVLHPVDGDVCDAGNMATSESTAPYASTLALVEGGNFKFTLLSADVYSETVLYFADAVNKRTDAKVTVGKAGSSTTYEMIVGKYDARPESNSIYAELTNYRTDNASDYIVRLVDTKLYVVATTNYALQKALDFVLDTYIKDDQGKIPANLDVRHRPHHYLRDMYADGSNQQLIVAGHTLSEYVIRTERYPSLLVQRAAVAIQEFIMENYGVVLDVVSVNSEGTNVGTLGKKEIRVGPMNGAVNMIRPEYTSFTQDNWQEHMTIESDGLIPGDYGYYEMSWDGDNIQLNGGSVYAISAATVRFMQMFEDLIKSKTTSLTPATTFTGNYESGFDYIYGRGYETVDFSLVDGFGLVYSDEFDYVGSDQKIYQTVRSKWTLSQGMSYPEGEVGGTAKNQENSSVFPDVYGENWWIAADANGNNYLFEIAKKHNKENQVIGGTEYTFYEGVRLASQEKWGFRYGIWETRAVMGTHNGSCSAVWSHTKEPYEDEIYWHEIDVYENYGQDAFVPALHSFDETLTTGNYKPNEEEGEEYNRLLMQGQFDAYIPSQDGTSKGGTNYQSESWELPAEGEHFWDTFHHLTVDWSYDYLRVCLDGEVVSRIILGEDGPEGAGEMYEHLYDAYRAGQTIKLSNGVGTRYYCKTQPVGQPVASDAFVPSYFLDDVSKYFEVQLVDYTRVYQTDNRLINYEPAKNDIRFTEKFAYNEGYPNRIGRFDSAQSYEKYDEGDFLSADGSVVATEEAWLAGYTSAKVTTAGDAAQLPLINAMGTPFTVKKGNDYIVYFHVKAPQADYDLQYSLTTAEGVVVPTETVVIEEPAGTASWQGWQRVEFIIRNCMYSGDLVLNVGTSADGARTFYIDDVYVEQRVTDRPADSEAMNFENYDVGTVLMSNNPGDYTSLNNEGSSVTVTDKRSYTGQKSAMFVTDTHSVNARAQMNVLDANGNNVKLEKGKTYWLSYKVYIEKLYANKYDEYKNRAIYEEAFNFYAACVPDDKVNTYFGSSYNYNVSANCAYEETGTLITAKSSPGTALEEHQTRGEWFEVSVKIEDCAVEGNLRLGISHYGQAKFICYVDDVRVYEGDQMVTVKFDTNGGADTYANLTVERDQSITAAIKAANLAEPTREHYIFRGWYTDPDFAEGSFINFNKLDTAEENLADAYGGEEITLYARWQDAEHAYDNGCDAICNNCGVVRDGVDHAFDNECDTTCNACGATRVTKHVYDNACDTTCHVCGDVRTVGDHFYDHACDADCNVCGYVREVEGHQYDSACDAICNKCEGVREVGNHVYDNNCDPICNECGDRRMVLHTYSSHMDTTCNVCGIVRWVGEAASTGVLNGKTALFVGDSITFGDKDTPRGNGWAQRLADDYGMLVTNSGEPGAVLSDAEGKKRLHSKFVEGDYDYVILQGGFNDMMVDSMKIGLFNPSKDPSTFDTSTFAGGLDRYFYYATTMYPDARIGFIITYDMPEAYTWANYSQAAEYWSRAREICAKWDVAYLDLYIPKYSEDVLDMATRTNNADGVHLNAAGYDVITPYIADWMATLKAYDQINVHADDGSLDFSGDSVTVFNHTYDSVCDPTCNECGDVREIKHVYAGDCDAYCDNCGERRRTSAEHVYDGASDNDCNVCGNQRCAHVYDGDCDVDCNECGTVRDAAAHTYDNACDVECNVCHAIRETEGHKYDNACDKDCNICGDIRETEGHKYDNACDKDCNICGDIREVGSHKYDHDCDKDCNICGDIREVNDHKYDNACDATCNTCGDIREVEGHKYDNACDKDCNICGDIRETEGHKYDNACDKDCNICGDVRVTSHTYASDCDAYCDVCKAHRESDVAHDYTSSTTVCSLCGHHRLRINTATLELQARINIIWLVRRADFDAYYENPYVVFELNGNTYTVDNPEEGYDSSSRPVWVFRFDKVSAKMMMDEVTATIYATNKETGVLTKADKSVTYSVKKYCTNQLASSQIDKNPVFKTLLIDMLNYGALAQLHFKYNVDRLANADLTPEQLACGTQGDPALESHQNTRYATCEDESRIAAKYSGVTLEPGDAVSIVYRITHPLNDVYGLTYKIEYGGTTKYFTPTADMTDEEFETMKLRYEKHPTKAGYALSVSLLDAKQMRVPVRITAYKDGVIVSHTLQYSIETYAYNNQAYNSSFVYLDQFVKAMIKYGDSTAAYFAN